MPSPRGRRRAAVLAGAAALGLTGLLLLAVGLRPAGPAPAPPVAVAAPASAAPAAPSDPPQPAPVAGDPAPPSPPAPRYTPSSEVRVTVPAVGLDLPLLPLRARGGAIDPPLLTAGYWVEAYGQPVGSAAEATNTLYLAAHSAGRGEDGFDPLLSADRRGAAVAAGDRVEVSTPGGTVTYTVDRVARYGKRELAGAAEVWERSPGRLVLITCLQQADGREATENLVVFAES